MRVAIVGGTGFVGSYIIDVLVERGHRPVLLVRPGSEEKVPSPEHCEAVSGDVDDPEALRTLLRQSEAVIFLIGILREFPDKGITFARLQEEAPKRVMALAEELGVRRFLLMSANGVRPDGTEYQRTKFAAEEALRHSGLDWTIIRPSVVFGDPRGRMEFATQLYHDIVAPPVPAPLFHRGFLPFGAGAMEMSPVHVRDVAVVYAEALGDADSHGRIYRLGGPNRLTWKRILKTIARATGHGTFGLPVPAWAVKLVAGWFERYESFPITRDQITMLMEGNTCDSADLFARLGIDPTPFDEAHLGYLKKL